MTQKISTDSRELETDILVIGGGGTGLAAAVSAAEEGAQVIVAEKSNSLGGTTGLSIGSITACCTSYQARQGIKDSPEALFEDVKKFNGELDQYDNKELLWVLIREGARTIDWLRSMALNSSGQVRRHLTVSRGCITKVLKPLLKEEYPPLLSEYQFLLDFLLQG